MIEVMAIDHIVLRTDRMDEMIAFYRDVLGCPVERETAPETGLVQLRAGSALIDLVEVQSTLGKLGGGAPSKSENNVDHFCLQITPISEQALIAHLEGLGVEKSDFANRYGAQGFGRSIYIKDPQGNTVELKCVKEA